MTKLEALAKDCIENHTHKLVDKPTKQDIYLREESIFIQGYRQSEKRIAELEKEVELWKKASENNSYKAFQLQEEKKTLSMHIVELQNDKGDLTDRCRELETQFVKCKEEIVKALKDCQECEWLPAHNGKAKYIYLQTVIDIVNEKFEEIKEK